MELRVLAFAAARDAIGAEESIVSLSEGADLASLREALTSRHPDLVSLWPRLAVAVDGELVRGNPTLSDGQEVALLPPVSGGAPSTATATGVSPSRAQASIRAVMAGGIAPASARTNDGDPTRTWRPATRPAIPVPPRERSTVAGNILAFNGGFGLAGDASASTSFDNLYFMNDAGEVEAVPREDPSSDVTGEDPMFVDRSACDLRLRDGSPARAATRESEDIGVRFLD